MKIENIVCNYFSVPLSTVLWIKTRKREIVQARQTIHYFYKLMYPKKSLATIGEEIGGKDHVTVIHGIKTINELIDTDKRFRAQIEELDRMIKRMINYNHYSFNPGDVVWTNHMGYLPILVKLNVFNLYNQKWLCFPIDNKNIGIPTLMKEDTELYHINPNELYDTACIDDIDLVKFNITRIMKPNFVLFIKLNPLNTEKVVNYLQQIDLTIHDVNGLVFNNTKTNTSYIIVYGGTPDVFDFTKVVISTDESNVYHYMHDIYPGRCVSVGFDNEIFDYFFKENNNIITKSYGYYSKAEAM